MAAIAVPDSLDLDHAEWIGSAMIRASVSGKMNASERDRTMVDRVHAQLVAWQPDAIALEEPLDGQIAWRGKKHQRTETAFRLGCKYGLALAAVHRYRPDVPSISYPVHNYQGRPGWMRGSHNAAIARVMLCLRTWGAPLDLDDDALMATGVAMAHVDQLRDARMEARILERRAANQATG